mgnify:CR=1 FL=1
MRKVNPHRELRPGYVFHMDMITWSHRSVEGNKYSIVMRCDACGLFEILNLYLKSDATNAFNDWIVSMRNHPLFADMPYPLVLSFDRLFPSFRASRRAVSSDGIISSEQFSG